MMVKSNIPYTSLQPEALSAKGIYWIIMEKKNIDLFCHRKYGKVWLFNIMLQMLLQKWASDLGWRCKTYIDLLP